MKLIFIVSSFLVSLALYGQTQPPGTAIQLDQYFQALTDLKRFNGNVIVAKDGKVLLERCYNIRGYPEGMRVGPDSKFIIASVSKFTRFVVSMERWFCWIRPVKRPD